MDCFSQKLAAYNEDMNIWLEKNGIADDLSRNSQKCMEMVQEVADSFSFSLVLKSIKQLIQEHKNVSMFGGFYRYLEELDDISNLNAKFVSKMTPVIYVDCWLLYFSKTVNS